MINKEASRKGNDNGAFHSDPKMHKITKALPESRINSSSLTAPNRPFITLAFTKTSLENFLYRYMTAETPEQISKVENASKQTEGKFRGDAEHMSHN